MVAVRRVDEPSRKEAGGLWGSVVRFLTAACQSGTIGRYKNRATSNVIADGRLLGPGGVVSLLGSLDARV